MKHHYLSVMGTMGVGKTTVTQLLAKALGYHKIEENFADNAFLPRFYEDMPRWAFHSQTFFLTEKVKQMFEVEGYLTETSVIQDTPIYQDVYSYARAHHELGNIDEAEWNLYHKIFTSFLEYLPVPDLIVYVDATVDTMVSRIHSRGRAYEQAIPRSYIELLDSLNTKWLSTNTIPVCTINNEGIDLVGNKADQDKVVETVRTFLSLSAP